MPNPRRVNSPFFQRTRVALIELAESPFVPGIVCGVVLCLLVLAAFAGLQRWEESANLKFEISNERGSRSEDAALQSDAQVGRVRSLREPACTARGSVARLKPHASRLKTSPGLLSTAAVPATNGPATFSQHGYATTCKAQLVGERFDNGHAADLGVCRDRLGAWGLGLEGESSLRNSHAADLGICQNILSQRQVVIAAATGAPALRHLARGDQQLVAGGLTLAVDGDAPGRERRCELPGVRLEFGLGSWGLSLERRQIHPGGRAGTKDLHPAIQVGTVHAHMSAAALGDGPLLTGFPHRVAHSDHPAPRGFLQV